MENYQYLFVGAKLLNYGLVLHYYFNLSKKKKWYNEVGLTCLLVTIILSFGDIYIYTEDLLKDLLQVFNILVQGFITSLVDSFMVFILYKFYD